MVGQQRVRVNGFQPPISSDQLKAFIIWPLCLVGYFLLIYVVLLSDESLQKALFSLDAALTAIFLAAWITVESINPEHSPGRTGLPVICFPPAEKSVRYCAGCRKTVLGLDHHCSWLNTCIGRRNYVPFLVVIFVGATQQILHIIVGFLSVTQWLNDPNLGAFDRISTLFHSAVWAYYLLVAVYLTLSFIMCAALVVLVIFHSYLMLWARMGTYDWLLHRRGNAYSASTKETDDAERREQSERERQLQRQREEWQRSLNAPRKKESYRIHTNAISKPKERSNRIAANYLAVPSVTSDGQSSGTSGVVAGGGTGASGTAQMPTLTPGPAAGTGAGGLGTGTSLGTGAAGGSAHDGKSPIAGKEKEPDSNIQDNSILFSRSRSSHESLQQESDKKSHRVAPTTMEKLETFAAEIVEQASGVPLSPGRRQSVTAAVMHLFTPDTLRHHRNAPASEKSSSRGSSRNSAHMTGNSGRIAGNRDRDILDSAINLENLARPHASFMHIMASSTPPQATSNTNTIFNLGTFGGAGNSGHASTGSASGVNTPNTHNRNNSNPNNALHPIPIATPERHVVNAGGIGTGRASSVASTPTNPSTVVDDHIPHTQQAQSQSQGSGSGSVSGGHNADSNGVSGVTIAEEEPASPISRPVTPVEK